jgi:hypothetical protein
LSMPTSAPERADVSSAGRCSGSMAGFMPALKAAHSCRSGHDDPAGVPDARGGRPRFASAFGQSWCVAIDPVARPNSSAGVQFSCSIGVTETAPVSKFLDSGVPAPAERAERPRAARYRAHDSDIASRSLGCAGNGTFRTR